MTQTYIYDLILMLIILKIASAADISRNFDNCDENINCVRKCCRLGYIFKKKKCLSNNSSDTIEVPVYKNKYNFIGTIDRKTKFLNRDITNMSCSVFKLHDDNPADAYFLQEDGTLWVPAFNQFYDNQRFCLDEFNNLTAFVCFPEGNVGEPLSFTRQTNCTGMIISMPFLLITFLVYLVLPESNLHRKALMSYVFALLVAYISLVTIQMYVGQMPELSCHLLAYLTIFFFLVSFFWMNVMCVDMWLAFSGMRTVISKRSAETRRFIFYCIYAWGVPVIHVGIVLLLNHFAPKDSSYSPQIGDKRCFLGSGMPTFYYFYLPMAILIGINVVLFVMTTVRIQTIQKETSMLKQTESKKSYEDDKQKFNLYLKLMFAMGVNWIMELVSWTVNQLAAETPQFVWYLTDFTNAMYGVLIFIIFVFKKKMWQTLKKRLLWMVYAQNVSRTGNLEHSSNIRLT